MTAPKPAPIALTNRPASSAPKPAPIALTDRVAVAAILALAATMLASWLPHYLLWPWWPDLDAWASIAQGWDVGVLPYRDVVIFNFPGQIYLCWAIGKVFGWGRTGPFYALDASLLVGLGALLASWSRRRMGGALPGLIGWAATLAAYLDLDYGLVAQRDWQAPLLASASLLVLQGRPGRGGRVASAALMAMGFAIRPHVVLFLPAAGLILLLDRREGASWRSSTARATGWGLLFAGCVALAFAPLLLQGLMGDFVRGVRQASYGSGYSRVTPGSAILGTLRQLGVLGLRSAFATPEELRGHLAGWKVLLTIAALVATIATAPPHRRRAALPWLLALLLAVLYEPLHPKRHAYLDLPLRLFWSLGWGVLAGLILDLLGDRPRLRAAAILAFVAVAVPGVPRSCSVTETLAAFRGWGARVPATAESHFFPGDPNTPYRWDDYRATLAYLRRATGTRTPVAAALRTVPFPGVNGVVGRVSPWPAESGVIWLWSVNPGLEGAFIAALERTPRDAVVVWSPEEKAFDNRLKLDALRAAIRRLYRPEATFGAIEVWRRR